ncbi:transglycosylase domain-containing protein [Desulfurivibrio alkaliphilus]|uniref:Peptidoglycan glycosyltransferase n=1 Tax=Desulfurivibrio alkaliphilus (strain DSM 19089 / UNIQEM U267 / AHT2) TaxID=589865 RepID=D6Z4A6_DESAT|nr:transglycosylase domain-containing protein [Desulfurivibrio alkaliphilus]ADH86381.1 Peptidoglycan glycosyltransferase [Desulfurivibrio alkaliphilus AHT 2]
MLKKIFYTSLLGGVTSLLLIAATLFWLVVISPGEEISRENIEKILAMESPVYYRDGARRVGVFFEQAHRQYVHFEQIPESFVHAIVAAEDSSFFDHYGIDFTGVARAALANIKARRVVQGGSTITQQTAKNLFERRDRSLASKLRELLYALRLEYHYEKEDILEFYANQFFVSGNARGLGMAARYFFDKPVEQLDLLESAFIAGSVKGPNHYNPFIQRDEEREERARRRARQRTGYVLEQMYRQNYLDEQQLAAVRGQEIPFNRGRMAYALNTLLDLVREGLSEPEVVEALSRHGIDNVATSGIRVITTVDGDLQNEGHHALQAELSRLDTRLLGYDHQALQQVYAELPRGGDWRQQPAPFMVGRITAIEGSERNPEVRVDLAGPRSPVGEAPPPAYLDRAGLFNLLQPLAHFRQPNRHWPEATAADLARLLAQLNQDDLVYVSVRERRADGELRLNLEKYPELQGGVLALQEGVVRAMVGGVDNLHYNRAVTARRPMGSAIKPLVYAAALQLGWNSADTLENRRNVFTYQKQAYFPRPFQAIRNEQVSMSWAGVTSENLASIWLLYHLLDHLSPARFTELVEELGLARGQHESREAYVQRIRDRMGVVVDRTALYNAAYARAVELIEPDLLFDGLVEEFEFLQKLHYGANFDRYREEVEDEFFAPGSSAADQREGRTRLAILEQNVLRYMELRDNLRVLIANEPELAESRSSGRLYRDEKSGAYIYSEGRRQSGWRPVEFREPAELPDDAGVAPRRFWGEVLLDGHLRVETLDLLEQYLEDEYRRLASHPPYDPQVLYRIRDFRVMTALQYLVGLSRALGVESRLDPVLSFPLGSNAISLLELGRIYESFQDGRLSLNAPRVDGGGLAIIKRIEASDGKVIYEPQRTQRRVFSPRIALAVSDILYNTMEHGTGRSATNQMRLQSTDTGRQEILAELDLAVPLFGKTGTANRYLNAAFAGYLPSPGERDHFSLGRGHTLAVYVGYDDNRPMVQGVTRVTGGAGAMPVWARLAEAVYRHGAYAAGLDLEDLAFSGQERVPVRYPALAQIEIPVEAGRGGVVSRNPNRERPEARDGAKITTFGNPDGPGELVLERFFEPYWRYTE